MFTFHWFDPKTGVERPLVTRTAVFMVPQTETTTWFHIFIFSRIGASFYRLLKPLVHIDLDAEYRTVLFSLVCPSNS